VCARVERLGAVSCEPQTARPPDDSPKKQIKSAAATRLVAWRDLDSRDFFFNHSATH